MHEVVVDFAALVPQGAGGLMLACTAGQQQTTCQRRRSTARWSRLKQSFRLHLSDFSFDLGAVRERLILFCLSIEYLYTNV